MNAIARHIRISGFLAPLAALVYLLLAPAAAQAQAILISPANGATVYSQDTTTFSWNAVGGATGYFLWVGTAPGSANVLKLGCATCTATSYTRNGFTPPPVPQTLYVRIYTCTSSNCAYPGTATYSDSSFTLTTGPLATLTTPANGSNVAAGTSVSFTWGAVSGAVKYYLYVGTTAGASDIVNSGEITTTSVVHAGLPIGTYYVTLYTKSAVPRWAHTSSTFTVVAPPTATLTSPADGSGVSPSAPVTFSWGAVNGALDYYLYVGTTAGAKDVVDSGEITAVSLVHAALPVGTYYVTLYTKSAGPTWTHTSSVFTSTACAASGGAALAGGGVWLPYLLTEAGGAANGSCGIGVISSALGSGTLRTVTKSPVTPTGIVLQIAASGGKLTSFSPYDIVYTARGGDAALHVYHTQLHDTSLAPTQVQVSSLAVTPNANAFDSSCIYQGYTQALDPTTAFLIVEVPTTKACHSDTAGNPFYWMNLTDGSAVAPHLIPASTGVATTDITALYTSAGVLTGLVLVDATGHLNFVSFPSFSVLRAVTSGVTGHMGHEVIATDRTGTLLVNGSVAFVDVQVGALEKLYRIDDAGASTLVYSTAGSISGGAGINGSTAHDNTNLYFHDVLGGMPNNTFIFLKTPIATAAVATTLYTDSASPPGQSYSIVDSDGKYLIIGKDTSGLSPSHAIVTLSLTTSPPVTPVTLVTTSDPTVIALRPFLDFTSDHLFVNRLFLSSASSSAVYTPSSSTAIVGQGGAGTQFEAFISGLRGLDTGVNPVVLEYTGITGTIQSQAGAFLYTVNPGTFAKTQVTQGGVNYVVPASVTDFFVPLSQTVGFGESITSGGSTNTAGLAIDSSKSKMLTITQAGVEVGVF